MTDGWMICVISVVVAVQFGMLIWFGRLIFKQWRRMDLSDWLFLAPAVALNLWIGFKDGAFLIHLIDIYRR